MSRRTRVVVIDDSPFVCALIARYLEASDDLEVIGTLTDGARAVERIRELAPDVITLDLEMPDVNGLEVLQRLMEHAPTPVVVISGVSGRGATMTLQALERGAVDFALKFTPDEPTDPELLRHEIQTKVRQAADIRVVRTVPTELQRTTPTPGPNPLVFPTKSQPPRVVVIGASTGGPLALRELLGHLPASFPGSIVIVQHIPASFTSVLAAQLQRHTELEVREADHGDRLQPNTVWVAPGGRHFVLGEQTRIALREGPAINGHCPSIDVTMQAVAHAFGHRAVGVVLTGMGSDGVHGLRAIRATGGTTYAQDQATSTVHGMPQRAIEEGVVDHIGSPRDIATWLVHHSATPQPLGAQS